MSVRVEGDTVYLEGRCGAEAAEALLLALHEMPARAVDVSGVQRLHMAVLQVLLAAGATLVGTPANPFLARHLINLSQ